MRHANESVTRPETRRASRAAFGGAVRTADTSRKEEKMKKLAVRLVLATSLALPTALARLEEFTPGPSPERVARLRDRPQAADAPQGRIDLLIVPCALAEAAPQPTLPPRVRRPASGDSRLTAGTDMSGHLLVIDTSGRLVGCAVPAPALAGG